MLYRDMAESIITSNTESGFTSTMINKRLRSDTLESIQTAIIESSLERDASIIHTIGDLTAAKEIVDKAPLYCNLLAQFNFNNILFVPHYDAGRSYNWLMPIEHFSDTTPYERMYLNHIVDYNIMFHLIPVILKEWWGINSTVTVPPESRYNNLMHDIYNRFGLNTISITQQYRIGEWFRLSPYPEQRFDAVVFLNNEIEDASNMRNYWNLYCTEDFNIVDIRYTANEVLLNDNALDIRKEISGVISNRASWDSVCRIMGMEMDADILKRSIHLY